MLAEIDFQPEIALLHIISHSGLARKPHVRIALHELLLRLPHRIQQRLPPRHAHVTRVAPAEIAPPIPRIVQHDAAIQQRPLQVLPREELQLLHRIESLGALRGGVLHRHGDLGPASDALHVEVHRRGIFSRKVGEGVDGAVEVPRLAVSRSTLRLLHQTRERGATGRCRRRFVPLVDCDARDGISGEYARLLRIPTLRHARHDGDAYPIIPPSGQFQQFHSQASAPRNFQGRQIVDEVILRFGIHVRHARQAIGVVGFLDVAGPEVGGLLEGYVVRVGIHGESVLRGAGSFEVGSRGCCREGRAGREASVANGWWIDGERFDERDELRRRRRRQ
mmetsp:Transcript_3485/g.5671  ORF Transcript_3485/g.5671 Transcript_3485/m.5671 type:complete len:335 (-) Transcript_3485:87-1091(-)